MDTEGNGMTWKLYEADCFDVFPEIEKDSIDLIILDPPYNIGKDKWDEFQSHEDYLKFIKKTLIECERVLKDNGSLYLWHNQFPVLCDFQYLINNNTDFVFKQMLIWNKRFNENPNKGFLDGYVEIEGLRNYQKMAEYCLFYTFQDETGLTKIYGNDNCFKPIRQYLQEEKEKAGLKTCKQINQLLGVDDSGGGMASHYFSKKEGFKQWALPTEEMYLKLQSTGFFQREYEDLRREYEDLRREYESLRLEYESLRYTFNNQKLHHSVLNYPIPKKIGHITPKPIELTEQFILHSSNEFDSVLIPFAGSGSEMKASKNLNRNVIGIEKEHDYCNIIRERMQTVETLQVEQRKQQTLTDFIPAK